MLWLQRWTKVPAALVASAEPALYNGTLLVNGNVLAERPDLAIIAIEAERYWLGWHRLCRRRLSRLWCWHGSMLNHASVGCIEVIVPEADVAIVAHACDEIAYLLRRDMVSQ